MFIKDYHVKDSTINRAGKGLFIGERIEKGGVIAFPDRIDRVFNEVEVNSFPKGSLEYDSSIRWFEKFYSVSPEWSDECYLNHSFEPNCLWHMGFIFALRDMEPGEEITVDYRFLLQEGETPGFTDSETGGPVTGFSWEEALYRASKMLMKIAGDRLRRAGRKVTDQM